jgi:predicted nucleotidyltransferase
MAVKELPEDLLQEIVRRLVEALDPAGIYLFGSHASETADTDSDVDLLVVMEGGDGDVPCRELARRGRKSLRGLGVPVDLVVCTTAEVDRWCAVPCNLIHTVAEKGRLVYESRS